MTTTIIVIAGIIGAGIVGTFVLSLTSGRPSNLGVENGRLPDVPDSPNCVSTQAADRNHWIEPITFESDPAMTMEALAEVVSDMPGSTIVERRDNYLYAEFRSPLFRFVDDVEFLLEPDSRRIHFRSASRVGHSDFGANRKRMEQIRLLFKATSQPATQQNIDANDLDKRF